MNSDEARRAAQNAGSKAVGMLDIGEFTEARELFEEAIEAIESVETDGDGQ